IAARKWPLPLNRCVLEPDNILVQGGNQSLFQKRSSTFAVLCSKNVCAYRKEVKSLPAKPAGPAWKRPAHQRGIPIMPACILANVFQPIFRTVPFKTSASIILGLAVFVPVAMLGVNLWPEPVLAADKQRSLNVDVPHISTDKSVKY